MTAIDIKLTDACKQYGFGPVKLYPANKIMRLDALKYWHKHHKRWPVWLEKLNGLVDRIMTKLFVRIFK
jgi:hypothetical protein